MENEECSKIPVEFTTTKFKELVFEDSTTDPNKDFESNENRIDQIMECQKNEVFEDTIGVKYRAELCSENGDIEFTDEEKESDISNEKDEDDISGNEKEDEENTGEDKELEILKDIVKLSYEKEGTIVKKDVGLTNDQKDIDIIYEKVNVESVAKENDVIKNIETDKNEIIEENVIRDDYLLKQVALDPNRVEDFNSLKIDESEKSYIVVCTKCGSNSKISISSTEKGSSSSSGSKSIIQIEDPDSKEPFKVPSDALVTKIVRQAEFYFSDFNILKNNFLLKHVRRNKEGYVSLKLVASFRKIKSLTKDWRVVAYSLESSKMLEINQERSKIRRIQPIPKVEETSLGKTVIVFNLPFQNPTSKDLIEMFSKFGNIVHVEIINPKSENYNTYHKRCRYLNQEIESAIFGCVEFEMFEDAMNAVKDEESHLPKENKMKVVALISQIDRTKRRSVRFNQYGQYPRKGRFKSRYEFQNDPRINTFGDYRYARPLLNEKPFGRFYQGSYKRSIHQSSSASEISDSHVASSEDVRNSSCARSRQLKLSNQMNISKQYVTHPARYVAGNFRYREA